MMDQAENLRNIIRQQNQNSITNARVIAVTSGLFSLLLPPLLNLLIQWVGSLGVA